MDWRHDITTVACCRLVLCLSALLCVCSAGVRNIFSNHAAERCPNVTCAREILKLVVCFWAYKWVTVLAVYLPTLQFLLRLRLLETRHH